MQTVAWLNRLFHKHDLKHCVMRTGGVELQGIEIRREKQDIQNDKSQVYSNETRGKVLSYAIRNKPHSGHTFAQISLQKGVLCYC